MEEMKDLAEIKKTLYRMKEKENSSHPPKTRDLWTCGIMRDDIPTKEYVIWLEMRRDHWMEKAAKFYYKKRDDYNEKLIEFARLVKECPANSVHLMPLAADALLKQLHTDPVVSEENNEINEREEPF